MKDRFHNPFDGSRKRSAPQPHKLEKDKEKYKPTKCYHNGVWVEILGYAENDEPIFKQLKEEE